MQRVWVTEKYWKEPILNSSYGIEPPFFYSAFFPYQDGLNSMILKTEDTLHRTFRIAFTDLSIIQLLTQAYPEYVKVNRRIFPMVKDSGSFYFPEISKQTDRWYQENLFTYELRIPLKDKNNFRSYMREDLNRFLSKTKGIHAIEENAGVNCWIVSLKDRRLLNNPKDKLKSIKADITVNGNTLFYKNVNINDLLTHNLKLLSENDEKPFIILNETGLTSQLLNLTIDFSSPETIRKSLNNAGFSLTYVKRKQKILAIKDIHQK